MWVLLLSAVAGAGAALAWVADQRQGRRRNARGACGACGRPWHEAPSGEPYLIHGRLVCEECAQRARRRMPWEFGALATFTAIAAGSSIMVERSVVVVVLFVVGATSAMTLGAVQLMKLANRDAQRRIAMGQSSEFDALRSGDHGPALPHDEGPGA
jgi:hypothetical protein